MREVVSRVVEPFDSLEAAALKIDYAVTGMTISRMRKGKVGLEQTVRRFASAFSERLCELYGEEIQGRFGRCDRQSAADWLAAEIGFEPEGRLGTGDRVAENRTVTYDTVRLADEIADRVAAKIRSEEERDPMDRIREAAEGLPPEPIYETEWEQVRIFGATGNDSISEHDLALLKKIYIGLRRQQQPHLPRSENQERPEGESQ